MADGTPLMEQYRKIKSEYQSEILFFRLGDFYEMFYSDAIEVSGLLNLTLTHRNGEPMCGIPYHASHSYIARLLKLGKKIAICEQLTPPGAKGIIERKVVEVITPGTILDSDFLDSKSGNFLSCVAGNDNFLSYSFVDLSTGEFLASACTDPKNLSEWLHRELERTNPSEVIIQQSLLEKRDIERIISDISSSGKKCVINRYPDWSFSFDASFERLTRQLKVASLKGFGLHEKSPEIFSIGTLLDYLEQAVKTDLSHIRKLRVYNENTFVGLDESTQKNLELVKNLHDGSSSFTLLQAIDATETSMGARLLKNRLLFPSREIDEINKRLDSVSYFISNPHLLKEAQNELSHILDIERLSVRIETDKAHAKDLSALGLSLKRCIHLLGIIDQRALNIVIDTSMNASILEIEKLIASSIKEDPSVLLSEGNIIKEGYSPELDHLHMIKKNSRAVLESYLEKEKSDSGLNSIKLKYNRIIGYYLELSKTYADKVPPHFIRRQSLINGERYTTERLGELELEISSADEKIHALEKELFLTIRNSVKNSFEALFFVSKIIAECDIACSNASIALEKNYVRPVLFQNELIHIEKGRHPVVENTLKDSAFIPNNLSLDAKAISFALITGPNMAGKSTFLRQNALIILLAHAGMYVPAAKAEIGLIDRMYCRVGAQDNLARGESTFLVEMNETANILNTATSKSFIIMDEVGRGTGTLDGLSIAHAVSEYLLTEIGARTLFATHYHELTALEHPKMVNMSPLVVEENGKIIFLKQVTLGPAESSYGIHVAGLAGIPSSVLKRAKEVKNSLQDRERELPHFAEKAPSKAASNMELFSPEELLVSEIINLDTNTITPIEALARIAGWKNLLKNK